MATNPFFSGRIPQELFDKVEEFCKETSRSKTEILINALSEYLKFPIPKPKVESQYVTLEMFEAYTNKISERLLAIENLKENKNIVITSDNNHDNAEEAENIDNQTQKLPSDNIVIENDNNGFNNSEKDNSLSDKTAEAQNLVIENLEIFTDNNIDNKEVFIEDKQALVANNIYAAVIFDVNSNKLPIYKSITSQELRKTANITQEENTNLKRQAFTKAQKKGYEITENIRFNPPIETNLKRGITINGHEYKLYCQGTDENKKPIWALEPNDNNSYQLDIIK
jgi:hypothetical protein